MNKHLVASVAFLAAACVRAAESSQLDTARKEGRVAYYANITAIGEKNA